MLSNAYFLAKFRFDTAENEPAKNLQNFANFSNFANPNPPGRLRGAAPPAPRAPAPGPTGAGAGAPRARLLRPPRALPGRGLGRRVVVSFWQMFGKFSLVFRLYQNEILQVNTRLTAFFKIYQII